MNVTYQPKSIEQAVQAYWDQSQTFKTNTLLHHDRKKNYYCLSMFPYTSGNIHMGHVRNYTIGDVMTRIKKMQGHEVLQPMGWDSFGLPAENAAIKGKQHPAQWTRQNIAHMKTQLKQIGFAYDWDREFATCDPEYYRWQQWLFIQMLEQGLVYKKESIVNWDPVDQTVLANEQVINGRGWRSNALVEQKKIPQWFCRITQYADALYEDLDTLTQWPEAVRTMQKNWIGKSKGTSITFAIDGREENLEVFTTRVDTLFGATFMAIAADHPLALAACKHEKQIHNFVEACKKQSTAEADIATAEKMGIATPYFAIHPLTGAKLPIWVANYILMTYGTGAIMAVPAEDERDMAFAEKYTLPVVDVFQCDDADQPVLVNAGSFDGLTSQQAKEAITAALERKGSGTSTTTYRLRDWGISRQRYWGVPIPIINCDHCGQVPEKIDHLPVVLPTDIEYAYGESLLRNDPSFYATQCPQCGADAHRETDTFDTFFDSSWYYHYFVSQGRDGMTSPENNHWMGVDLYIGGIEHAILHLLYARFIQKVLVDLGQTSVKEPFKQLLSQGMVLKDGAKMSKSKGNVVSPDDLIDKFGCDTIRFFMIFAAPPTQDLDWSDGGVEGCFRFLKRLWSFVHAHLDSLQDADAQRFALSNLNAMGQQIIVDIHKQLQVIARDCEQIHLNTVASGAMKLFHKISKLAETEHDAVSLKYAVSILLRILNPITPHITHALWYKANFGGDISLQPWPEADEHIMALESQVTIVLQINGKKKGAVSVQKDASEAEVMRAMHDDSGCSQQLEKITTIEKSIFVKNKLINLVV